MNSDLCRLLGLIAAVAAIVALFWFAFAGLEVEQVEKTKRMEYRTRLAEQGWTLDQIKELEDE